MGDKSVSDNEDDFVEAYVGCEEIDEYDEEEDELIENIAGSASASEEPGKRKRRRSKMSNKEALVLLRFLAGKKRNEFLSTLERGTIKEQARIAADILSSSQGPDFTVLARPDEKYANIEKITLQLVESTYVQMQTSRAVTFPFTKMGCKNCTDTFAEQSIQNAEALRLVDIIHNERFRLPTVREDYTFTELQSDIQARPTAKVVVGQTALEASTAGSLKKKTKRASTVRAGSNDFETERMITVSESSAAISNDFNNNASLDNDQLLAKALIMYNDQV